MGRKAALIGLVGTLVPIAAGVALVYAVPHDFWGEAVQAHFFAFALFVGMNLANSANPVLARILMDLGLLNGGIGTLCMTATIVDDLVNWTLFAIILSDIAPSGAVQRDQPPHEHRARGAGVRAASWAWGAGSGHAPCGGSRLCHLAERLHRRAPPC